MGDDPKEICQRLDELAKSRPSTAETVRKVEMLLLHSREGVQVKAAQTLACWVRPSSKAPLQELLLRTVARRRGTSVRKQIAIALAPFLDDDDADWVLDLYFSTGFTELLPLLQALPGSSVVERIREESQSSTDSRRRAAIFAARTIDDH